MNKPKLSEKKQMEIAAKYGAGGISASALAAQYGVCATTIKNICNRKKADIEKFCAEEKEKAKISMREFLAERLGKAQNLMDYILDIPPEEIKSASLRDKMGALKILRESFADTSQEGEDGRSIDFTLTVKDVSKKDQDLINNADGNIDRNEV